MKERVMVTGGAGFIGSAILQELRKLELRRLRS